MTPVALLLFCTVGLAASGPISEASLAHADLAAGQVLVALGPQKLPPGTRLVLTAGARPVGWYRLVGQRNGQATFERTCSGETALARPLRGWLVAPDLMGRLLEQWPDEASLYARIDRIGPGARTVWVRAGADQGVRPGDHWWMRIAGQPVVRLDVRTVEPSACFCAVVSLASDLALITGQTVELWPTPGRRRSGAAHSAVAFVDSSAGAPTAWVPAPPHVACPRDAHVDFYRRGRYLAHGVVEARDELFRYVRIAPTASAEPVRVGDDAVLRSLADIEQERFVARVFEVSSGEALINTGETDGLALGQAAWLVRAGRVVGKVELRRVQRVYSVIRCVGDDPGVLPAPGDEVHFRRLSAAPPVLAEIETVTNRTLFTVRLSSASRPPLMTPLAIRSAGHTSGVAVLLTTEGALACGLALEPSLAAPVKPGDTLLLPGS